MYADPPHLIKLLRNHFVDSGFKYKGVHITKQPLVELLSISSSTLRTFFKLGNLFICYMFYTIIIMILSIIDEKMLNPTNFERQKVKYATKLFSRTNSAALSRAGSLNLLKSKNWVELSEFNNVVSKKFHFL